jgi:DNA-binding LacI/PurR family transcriptional regulator
MQQIADKAGVSRMAVSLALRSSPKVSADTSARIRKIAEELGYRPNPLVSALMTQLRQSRPIQRPTTIAYATAFSTADAWRKSSLFLQFFEGARKRAEALGYELEEWWMRKPGLTEQRFCEILFNRDIHGLLVAPLPTAGVTLHLDWPKFASATIGYSFADTALHRTSNDQYGSIMLALRELMLLGYRRIGLALTREENDRVERHWTAGMLVYQSDLAPEQRVPPLLAEGSFGPQFSEWFRAHQPDVVLSQSSECLPLLEGLGTQVPKEVGFAHLALSPGDSGVSGVDQNSELVGAAAIDLLDAQLRRNEHGIPPQRKTVLISGFWVPGATVRDVNGTKKRK